MSAIEPLTVEQARGQIVACHGCGVTTHAEHLDAVACPTCGRADRAYCCACWEAEDTGCGADLCCEDDEDDEAEGQQP